MISHLGRYEIIDEIGQGAMGIVYKARDPLIDRIIAIKTINLDLTLDNKEEYEGRFYQEARAAGRLSHSNIVTIYDVGKSGDVAYIAMEFLQGRELRDILDENPHLLVTQILHIAMQVALGLAYAHEQGVVHRDVKPSNIMVLRGGNIKITDFGIARLPAATVRTQTGMVLGSPKYMSPEQLLGKSVDQRSDIFSLGVMLYEMLTGHPPFVGDTINAVMSQTMNAVPPSPGSLNPAVPAMLDLIVAKALEKEPSKRYQNAREIADALRTCLEAMPRFGNETDKTNYIDSLDSMIRPATITTPEDVEITTGTRKITRPNPDRINQASPQTENFKAEAKANMAPITRTIALPPKQEKRTDSPRTTGYRKLALLLLLLVLLGLLFIH